MATSSVAFAIGCGSSLGGTGTDVFDEADASEPPNPVIAVDARAPQPDAEVADAQPDDVIADAQSHDAVPDTASTSDAASSDASPEVSPNDASPDDASPDVTRRDASPNDASVDAKVDASSFDASPDAGPCPTGFTRDPSGQCIDDDECATNNGGCNVHAKCTNTPGSRTCACLPPYVGNGISCAEPNYCATNNGGCSSNAICANASGGASCTCKSGFIGDGRVCVDINECLTNNGGCDPNATCTNTAGSRTCTCPAGQLGDGSWCKPMMGHSMLAVGFRHTCAITSTGGVKCWGSNAFGALGTGSFASSNVPVDVVGLGGTVVAVGAGTYHTCALLVSGAIECWGMGANGQLGNGQSGYLPSGQAVESRVPYQVSTNMRALAVGGWHNCGVRTSGQVQCWGGGAAGQIGNGAGNDRSLPTVVQNGLTGAIAVAAAADSSCAMTGNGAVHCWGGDIHSPIQTTRAYPRLIIGGGIFGIAGAGYDMCAAQSNGQVSCWTMHALTVGTPNSVASLQAFPTFLSGGGSMHQGSGCALFATFAPQCWGINGHGQLGNGSTASTRVGPVNVVGLPGSASSIGIAHDHACARVGTHVYCWGDNTDGELGNGTNVSSLAPVDVGAL